MKKFIYKNEKTGERVESEKLIDDKSFVLIFQRRDGLMNKNKIYKK